MAAKRAKHRARTLRVDAKPGMVELTASKRTFIECTCACSSKGPNGCKDIRVCPPSPRQGRSCSFKGRLGASAKSLTTINGTPQSMSTGRNDQATIRSRSWGLHTEPANDTNRRSLPPLILSAQKVCPVGCHPVLRFGHLQWHVDNMHILQAWLKQSPAVQIAKTHHLDFIIDP